MHDAKPLPVSLIVVGAALTALLASAAAGNSADGDLWLQWGGPGRDFKSSSTGLAERWPASGPPELWVRSFDSGYSAIVADGERLYTMGRRDSQEVVSALDPASGETLWEHSYPAPTGRMDTQFGAGPHASPLVVGNRLFTVGGTAILHALDRSDGSVLWSHDLYADFGGTFRPRGYSSSPLAFEDLVILPVGGGGRAVMAFDQADGRVVWESGSFANGQSSPILVEIGGEPQVVAFMADTVAGFDARTGILLWTHPHATDYGLNISTPVWDPETGVLFVSSAYNGGSRALRLWSEDGRTRVEELWSNNRMRVHFGTVLRLGDHVYGSSGDFGPSFLSALDLTTGRVVWRDRSFAKASFLWADDKLIVLDEDGALALARISPEGLDVLSRADISEALSWTVPTLAGTTLYVRDLESIRALDLSG